SHDFDLVHQRISVRDFDWDSLAFKGQVVTTLVARQPGLDSVVLDAGSRLRIRSPLRTSRHGDTVVVHLAKPAARGDTISFRLDYDARITNGRGLTFIGERPHTPRSE